MSLLLPTREGDQDDPTRMVIQEWLWGDGPKRVRLEGRTLEPGPQLYYARPTDQPDVYRVTAAFNTDRLDHDRALFAEFKTVRSVFRGRIVLQDGGRKIPLAGAIVRARSDRQFAQTITVGDGSFEFLGLPQSWYLVSVQHDGARAEPVRIRVPALGCVGAEMRMERYGFAERATEWMQVIGGYYDVLHDVAVDTLRGR